MAQEITMQDLEAKQKAMIDAAMKLNDMSDGEEISKEAGKLQKQGEELEAMAKAFEQQELDKAAELRAKYGIKETAPSFVRVELTDDQRKQILDETGVRIEVVELEDGREVSEDYMPEEHPDYILAKAREKAERQKAQGEAKEKQKEAVGAALEELEKGPSDVQRMLAEKKKDPEFLANLGLDSE